MESFPNLIQSLKETKASFQSQSSWTNPLVFSRYNNWPSCIIAAGSNLICGKHTLPTDDSPILSTCTETAYDASEMEESRRGLSKNCQSVCVCVCVRIGGWGM